MPEMSLNREVLGWLIAARTGHGHFADYHERFGHEEVDVHCRCGQKRSRLHPFSCPHARLHRAKLFSLADRRPFTPNEILGTAQGVKIFAEWAPKTELFRRNRGYGEPAGLKELSLDGRSFDHPVKLQQVYYFVAYHRQNGLIRPIYRSAL